MAGEIIDIVLLLALPASGKSELRRYLDGLDAAECRERYHLGPTAQLDDYPYVHLMRRIDDELEAGGQPRVFFGAADRGFQSTTEWGTLIALVNEDFVDIRAGRERRPDQPVAWLLDRYARARAAAGAPSLAEQLNAEGRALLETTLAPDVAELLDDWNGAVPSTLDGRTVVIEFARGGPDGASMPLEGGYGYQHSLSLLHPDILARAGILYIWVTPEQSRAKNNERARPNADGSILFHGVPEAVMYGDYGCDDLDFLLGQSGHDNTVKVAAHQQEYLVATARFDNRADLTTFLRAPRSDWDAGDVEALSAGLTGTMDRLWASYASNQK